jgi:hypothetical protein
MNREKSSLENEKQPSCLTAVMPSLPLDVIDFIGRCNLYRENGKWYSEDGCFANSDLELLEYIVKLNMEMDALGNEA